MAKELNPDRLRDIRVKRGMSQSQLAERLGVDGGTVSRWERGVARIRPSALRRLCEVLDVSESDLCGNGPIPDHLIPRPSEEKDQMNLMVDPACRNALALVAMRYGITRQDIVEIAPLLFFIAAEMSLQRRWDVLCDSDHMHEDNEAALAEGESIKKRDLFGEKRLYWPRDDEKKNPFALFLGRALYDVQRGGEFEGWGIGDTPRYSICTEDIRTYLDEDEEATELIRKGCVALHEMPHVVRKASPKERAEWVHNKWKKWARDREGALDMDAVLKAAESISLQKSEDDF